MMKSRKIVIEIPEEEYNIILLSDKTAMSECASKEAMMYAIKNGTLLPEGAEILTKEAYSDLCLRASKESKTGRWSVNEVGVVRCPFCHANMNPRKNRKPKYCDQCGAKLVEANE